VVGAAFVNRLFIRLVAKDRRFSKIDFRYSTLRGRASTEDHWSDLGVAALGSGIGEGM